MRFSNIGRLTVLCAGVAVLGGITPAGAQVPPPPSPEAADVASCLCLRRAVDALSADLGSRKAAYDASLSEVAALDTQLQSARTTLNVDNQAAVAQYRQLLERRDAAFRQSNGPLFAEFSNTTERYNARSNEYNARCTNRPMNPAVVAQVQPTLTCPPY